MGVPEDVLRRSMRPDARPQDLKIRGRYAFSHVSHAFVMGIMMDSTDFRQTFITDYRIGSIIAMKTVLFERTARLGSFHCYSQRVKRARLIAFQLGEEKGVLSFISEFVIRKTQMKTCSFWTFPILVQVFVSFSSRHRDRSRERLPGYIVRLW